VAGSNFSVRGKIKKERSLPLFLLFILFYIPLFFVFIRFFADKEAADFSKGILKILQTASIKRTLIFTLLQALLSALFSILLAFPGAALFSHYRFKAKKALLSLSAISFILPPILVVLAFVQFWGQNGWVNQLWTFLAPGADKLKILYSAKAIIMAHIFYNLPLALRFLYDGWQSIPKTQQEAGYSLGASPARTFFRVTIPQLLPSVLSSFLIIFLYCFLSFSIILVLGGGPRYSTLEVEIYQQIKFSQHYFTGGLLALLEISISILAVTVYLYLERKRHHYEMDQIRMDDGAPLNRSGRILLWCYTILFMLFLAAPMVSMVSKSFLYSGGAWSGKQQLSLHWFQSIFSLADRNFLSLKAIMNSLFYAFSSTLLVTVLCSLLGHLSLHHKLAAPKFTQFILLLPMGISTVILSLGYLILSVHLPNAPWVRTSLIIIIHAFTAIPFAYRAMINRIEKLPPNLIEAAQILGAPSEKVFNRIEWPMLRPAIITGALFSFALSIGEVNAVLVLARTEQTTIPLAIYRLIGNYNFNGASAMGTLLIFITLGIFLLLEKWNHEN